MAKRKDASAHRDHAPASLVYSPQHPAEALAGKARPASAGFEAPVIHQLLFASHCLPNRNSPELEFVLTHSKQTTTTLSNRNKYGAFDLHARTGKKAILVGAGMETGGCAAHVSAVCFLVGNEIVLRVSSPRGGSREIPRGGRDRGR